MKKQIDGINILKVIACISVILLHYTEYYYSKVDNSILFMLLHMFRWLVFGCIGYFCLCTGYLQYKKNLSKDYYKKIIKIIIVFLIYSTLSFIMLHKPVNYNFRNLYNGTIYYFFDFNGYYWYMAMYFGLYLIIPFLNIIIEKISKKQHLFLIIILIILFSGHDFIMQMRDIYPIFKNINITGYYSSDLFPILYYFIGSYINKYNINKSKNILVFSLILSLALHSYLDLHYTHLYNYELSNHVYTFNSYGNIFTIISCVTTLLLVKNINLKYTSKIIKFISSKTLPIYLGLGIMDKYQDIIANKVFSSKVNFSFKGMIIWLIIELIGGLLLGLFVTKFIDYIKELLTIFINYIKKIKPIIGFKKYIIKKYTNDLEQLQK